jgi:indole-3-glycerol phosphate synthase
MSILDSIIAAKKREIENLPSIKVEEYLGNTPFTPHLSCGIGNHHRVPQHERTNPKVAGFINALIDGGPCLIAEIKPRSPSEGELMKHGDLTNVVRMYEDYAQAISVLCDAQFFGGGFDLLYKVRSLTYKPLLAKDFFLSTKQIDHAITSGANAILLIAAILDVTTLFELATYAIHHQLDVLLEVHSEEDIEKVVQGFGGVSSDQKNHMLFGINNRDLQTMVIDLRATETLAPVIRTHFPDHLILSEHLF